ncbi:MAG: mannose-6-phosphate isomerase, class I [Lewinella sp.]
MPAIYPFSGTVQHYAWGGHEYLPKFLRQGNPQDEPWAELWMGAHAKGPGVLLNEDRDLAELIASAPEEILGRKVAERFAERLPFLFKVLDVREMLSIQVHPTKKAAEKGFAKEEANGPERDAPDRNYRDDNHKPELGVALTDFYLLHGFRSADQISRTLDTVPGWEKLRGHLDKADVKGLYAYVMKADQLEVDDLLEPLARQLDKQEFGKSDPAYWAKQAFEQYTVDGHYDRGIFSVYWFNLVHLSPGEGIFQDAGIPHAYLEGACLELMANSDNVLRGGLTPKHIDVPELMRNTRFGEVLPAKIRPEQQADGWNTYPTPAPDFELSFRDVPAGEQLAVVSADGPSILLLMEGSLSGPGKVELTADSRTVFVAADEEFVMQASAPSRVFRARVGKV